MKKLLLVAVGAMVSLQVAADPMVRGGAFSGRVNHAADEAVVRAAVHTGAWAGKKVGGWVDDFCQYSFGVDGKTVADKVATAVLIAVITTGVYKTGQYIAHRESNMSKVKRAMSLWMHMNAKLNDIATLQDVQNFVYNFKHLEQSVLDSYTSLNNRYGSWVKPWNWTSEMQKAHTKMKLASMIFSYQDIIIMQHEYNEVDLLKIATADFSTVTAYPVCAYVDKLQSDIEIMKGFASAYNAASVMLRELNKALRIIAGSKDYVEERRALQDAIARERLANAIDRHY